MCVIVMSVTIGFLTREEVMISHRSTDTEYSIHSGIHPKKKKTHQSINIIETIKPRIMREALKSMEVYTWNKAKH